MTFLWWHYLLVFQILWTILIVRYLNRLFNGGLDYIIKEDKEHAEKFSPFNRKDIEHWNKTEIYIGAIFLLPYRIFLFGCCTVGCAMTCAILAFKADLSKELPSWRRYPIRFFTFLFPRLIFLIAGFYYIETKSHKITDFEPDYPVSQLNRKNSNGAPIIVSNHISFIDIFHYLTCLQFPCFLSKAEVANIPLIGYIAKVRQSIFVDRTERSQKDLVMGAIKERVDSIQSGKKFPPMLIFPEGTTTSGHGVISFKKGAFANLAPVRIYCLEYPKKSFSPAYDNLLLPICTVILFSQFYNRIIIHDIGTYYPDHLNLKEEADWEKYGSRVKNIMCKCLNVPSYNIGFTEKNEYYKYGKTLMKTFSKKLKNKELAVHQQVKNVTHDVQDKDQKGVKKE